MPVERTLSIVKPDAVARNLVGRILARFEEEGLRPVGIRMLRMSPEQAGAFYDVHLGKPFYEALVEFMTSGPCVVMALEGENAIAENRRIMGATDPAKAAAGTLRALYAASVQRNAVHGSDAPETAMREIAFFFPELC
jgi:nucleoside-diphosphate kinase